MAENPPISTSVPETVTVDTGADAESIGTLNDSFKDFWKEEDEKVEGGEAPAAPGPAQETKPETKKEEPAPSEPQAPVQPPAKEVGDDDIDKLELSNPNARPEIQQDFKNIKEMWKADRARTKEIAQKAAKLEQDLAEARQNSWTPESRADYEHAAQIRRKFDFVSDPDFIAKFHQPVRTQFESILEEAVGALPDRDAAIQWANYIKANYSPDALNRDWWLNSVIAKVPNPMDQASILSSVTQLIKMQKERDTEINRRTNDKSSFDNWISEKTEFTAKRIQEEIMTEIGTQEKRIQEVLPRDIAAAKTTEERRAIEEHNARFDKLNGFFKETMQDISKNGPRAWVRASIEATRAMLLEGNYKELETELKSVKAERDQYKQELDKITGARRKISHTTGTPPASSNNGKKQTSEGLSIKDLDVRNSFKNFDWGDGT
jgi:hypothetical protein